MPASFLGLPAELRNEIYMDLLVRTEPIDPWSSDNRLAPNLLYTNMKILREAGHYSMVITALISVGRHPNL